MTPLDLPPAEPDDEARRQRRVALVRAFNTFVPDQEALRAAAESLRSGDAA